jgi:hypothetical protein
LLILFHFALWNASSHLAFPQGQKMMVFPSFLSFCSSHCPRADWWDFSCKKGVSAVFLHSPSYLMSKGYSCLRLQLSSGRRIIFSTILSKIFGENGEERKHPWRMRFGLASLQ